MLCLGVQYLRPIHLIPGNLLNYVLAGLGFGFSVDLVNLSRMTAVLFWEQNIFPQTSFWQLKMSGKSCTPG